MLARRVSAPLASGSAASASRPRPSLPRCLLHTAQRVASFDPFGSSNAGALSTEPLRLAVLGAGLSGLTLAQQLQRQLRQAGRQNVEITLHEKTDRSGGWVRSQVLQSSPSSSYLLERGPRSLMFRDGDPSGSTAVELLRQLDLGSEVVLADKSAACRYVWNRDAPGAETGHLVLLPAGLKSFWQFPHRSALIASIKREFSEPPIKSDVDESIAEWATRRLGATVAEEIIDPMIAGIYAGDTSKLSMSSCLSRLPAMEARSGGVIRDTFLPPPEVKAARKAAAGAQFDEEQKRLPDTPWMTGIKSHSIYSLKGGMSVLTRALRDRLATDANDPYIRTLPGRDAQVTLSHQSGVTGLRIDDANKPVLQLTSADGTKSEAAYDHVFSTLPSFELHSILTAPSSQLPLGEEHRARLASLLSIESMPFASVWVVNIVYDSAVLAPNQAGFGLLVPSKHVTPGAEVLGITFDSCVFPEQSGTASETRLTVMIGGDRQAHLASAPSADIELHALRAVHTMLGIDPRVHRPVLVDALLNRRCIPQYYVGHARKAHETLQILQHLAHTPSSVKPTSRAAFPTVDVPLHAAAASNDTNAHRPMTLLGTSFCGVSLGDCIHHATAAAADFVQRETAAAKANQ